MIPDQEDGHSLSVQREGDCIDELLSGSEKWTDEGGATTQSRETVALFIYLRDRWHRARRILAQEGRESTEAIHSQGMGEDVRDRGPTDDKPIGALLLRKHDLEQGRSPAGPARGHSLMKHQEGLALSALVLDGAVESTEEFAIRRVNSVRDKFLATRTIPTRSHFICEARLSAKVKQRLPVRKAIEEALCVLRKTIPVLPPPKEVTVVI